VPEGNFYMKGSIEEIQEGEDKETEKRKTEK